VAVQPAPLEKLTVLLVCKDPHLSCERVVEARRVAEGRKAAGDELKAVLDVLTLLEVAAFAKEYVAPLLKFASGNAGHDEVALGRERIHV
jgi:hypothetical protein